MLQQNEYPTKTIRNVIRKAINRNQQNEYRTKHNNLLDAFRFNLKHHQ